MATYCTNHVGQPFGKDNGRDFSHSLCWSSMASSFARSQPDACYGGSGRLRTGNGRPPRFRGGAEVEPMSTSVVGGTEEADLLPPVPLVALNLLLGHAQDLTQLGLR